MGRRCPTVLLKRTIAKASSVANGFGAYPAIPVLRAFAKACIVKDSTQAEQLVELLDEAENEGNHPMPYGTELTVWVQRMIIKSFYDAKAEAEDKAERRARRQGGSPPPFVPEFEFKFKSHWIVVAEPKELECKLSLAEHDEGYSIWIQTEERRPCIAKAVKCAMTLMEALGENAALRVWVPVGLQYELEHHERRSILDVKSTAEHYRLY